MKTKGASPNEQVIGVYVSVAAIYIPTVIVLASKAVTETDVECCREQGIRCFLAWQCLKGLLNTAQTRRNEF